MYQEQGHRESLHQKEKKAKKMKPMEPVSGVGRAGRLGASETQSFVHSMYPETLKFEDVSVSFFPLSVPFLTDD